MKNFVFCFLVCFYSLGAVAGPHYQGGTIIDLTSSREGVMIRLAGNAVPDNCVGTPSGWMRINTEDTAMMAVALSVWSRGKTTVNVYTDGKDGAWCVINQFDPAN